MNIRDAWGFLSFGLVMGLLPSFAPAWFPPTGIDGSSARAMWLELMGAVQTSLGGGRVLWPMVGPAVTRWLAYVPPMPATVAPFELEKANVSADSAPAGVKLAKAA
jgi:hypothetical protein